MAAKWQSLATKMVRPADPTPIAKSEATTSIMHELLRCDRALRTSGGDAGVGWEVAGKAAEGDMGTWH